MIFNFLIRFFFVREVLLTIDAIIYIVIFIFKIIENIKVFNFDRENKIIKIYSSINNKVYYNFVINVNLDILSLLFIKCYIFIKFILYIFKVDKFLLTFY